MSDCRILGKNIERVAIVAARLFTDDPRNVSAGICKYLQEDTAVSVVVIADYELIDEDVANNEAYIFNAIKESIPIEDNCKLEVKVSYSLGNMAIVNVELHRQNSNLS